MSSCGLAALRSGAKRLQGILYALDATQRALLPPLMVQYVTAASMPHASALRSRTRLLDASHGFTRSSSAGVLPAGPSEPTANDVVSTGETLPGSRQLSQPWPRDGSLIARSSAQLASRHQPQHVPARRHRCTPLSVANPMFARGAASLLLQPGSLKGEPHDVFRSALADAWVPGGVAQTSAMLPLRPFSSAPGSRKQRDEPGSSSSGSMEEVAKKLQEVPMETAQTEPSKAPTNYEWQVLEFAPGKDGGAPAVEAKQATPETLGLAPRDVSLFAATTGPGKQRATIVARGQELLFRSECCRAIVRADRAFLFPARRAADTLKIAQAIRSNIARGAKCGTPNANGNDPFEFRVLESLLASTVSYFEGKAARLTLLTDSVLSDVMDAVSSSSRPGAAAVVPSRVDLQQLLPIQRSLTELTADVQETGDAIAAVADDDASLAGLCLSNREPGVLPSFLGDDHKQKAAMYRGATLLQSYQRQVASMDGALRELEENIDTVREVWHMSLDNTRNKTLQLNLLISIASFAMLLSTVPASFFGMNLDSGLEEVPHLLWYIGGGCLALSAFTFGSILLVRRRWPDRQQERKVRDLGATRELLTHHLSDLDDVLAVLRKRQAPVDKEEFAKLVSDAQHMTAPTDALTGAEIDLLFKAFDTNRDGCIDAADALRSRQDLAAREAGRLLK